MIKFIKLPDENNHFDNSTIEMTTEEIGLSEMLEDFEDFLLGCGFRFDGRLDIVYDEEGDL